MSLLSLFTNYKSKKPPNCTVVIAAAGSSVRYKGEDKLLLSVAGKPVIMHAIEAFERCKLINEIIVVTSHDKVELISEMCADYALTKVKIVIKGGETRLESVLNGVYAASKKSKLIAIHDGARPCISSEIIEEIIKKAAVYNAAAPGVQITSTVKRVIDGVITETVDRDSLIKIQTPQIFRAEIIKAALSNAKRKQLEITDDCMAVEAIGVPVRVVEGSRKNIKITTPDDLQLAQQYLSED